MQTLEAQVSASRERETPGILGAVIDRESRQPIEGVAVTLRRRPDSSDNLATLAHPDPILTDRQGRFVFLGARLIDGHYDLGIGRIGYESIVDSLVFRSDLGLRIEAALVPDAMELDPLLVVVEARSQNLEVRGFYDRRARGVGDFLTRDEIDRRNAIRMSDLFRRIPGVSVRSRGRFSEQSVVTLRGGCVADIFVDGVSTVSPFPVDFALQPQEVDAIEVYHSSELPAEFGTTTCGAVMIWTLVPNRGTGNGLTWVHGVAALGILTLVLTRF